MINYNLKYPIIAVDWDNCLMHWVQGGPCNDFEYKIDEAGIYYLKLYKELMGKIILFTCRADKEELDEIVNWCKRYGLEFDAINENIPEHLALWLSKHPNSAISPKPFWNLLIDDTAYGAKIDWKEIGKEILKTR